MNKVGDRKARLKSTKTEPLIFFYLSGRGNESVHTEAMPCWGMSPLAWLYKVFQDNFATFRCQYTTCFSCIPLPFPVSSESLHVSMYCVYVCECVCEWVVSPVTAVKRSYASAWWDPDGKSQWIANHSLPKGIFFLPPKVSFAQKHFNAAANTFQILFPLIILLTVKGSSCLHLQCDSGLPDLANTTCRVPPVRRRTHLCLVF